jgi:hypothetical protein
VTTTSGKKKSGGTARVRITLDRAVLEDYRQLAALNKVPLATMLRVVIEQGAPMIRNAVKISKEVDPQMRLLLVRGLQASASDQILGAELLDDIAAANRLDHGHD